MKKYQGKYRIASARADWRRYDEEGKYFLTICADNHRHYFGEITNGVMALSDAGRIIEQEWGKSFLLRHELRADEFVIMPNHLHAIIEIVGYGFGGENQAAAQPHEMENAAKKDIGQARGVAYRTPKSISSFVAGFKSAVTKRVKTLPGFEEIVFWQSKYYDRIIRNEREYGLTKEYIRNNVVNWGKDTHNMAPHCGDIL